MKTIYYFVIAGMVIIAIMIAYYENTMAFTKTTKSGCTDPRLADLQYDAKRLATRQQVDSITLANPEIKNIIDRSTYCEFMSLSTLYTGNGSYQVININLNNTKVLAASISLQNSSVASYRLSNLTRTYAAN